MVLGKLQRPRTPPGKGTPKPLLSALYLENPEKEHHKWELLLLVSQHGKPPNSQQCQGSRATGGNNNRKEVDSSWQGETFLE